MFYYFRSEIMSLLEKIKDKINKEFEPDHLQLIDNSNLHATHKSYDPQKLHLKIIIKSIKFDNLSKIDSHRLIFSILGEEMKNKIHALEIEIK
tara:strand:+ start:2431 stop:2709 length:279 start_codon:yes stop_codon:yes gene_type:complete